MVKLAAVVQVVMVKILVVVVVAVVVVVMGVTRQDSSLSCQSL